MDKIQSQRLVKTQLYMKMDADTDLDSETDLEIQMLVSSEEKLD